MKIISLTQPWASLMAVGAKHNETRSWSTTYRGDLAIAASKQIKWPDDEQFTGAALKALVAPTSDALHYDAGFLREILASLPVGKIVCVVRIVQMLRTARYQPSPPESLFGDYTIGRWAWITRDCRRLRNPIPWKGSQGIRDVPPDVESAIKGQL